MCFLGVFEVFFGCGVWAYFGLILGGFGVNWVLSCVIDAIEWFLGLFWGNLGGCG